MPPSTLINSHRSERWFLLLWLTICVWLLICAFVVQGEYGDGYQTIVNARFLFGDSPNYYVQRGPLPAIVLWPVEMFVKIFSLDPIDVRPHHFLSALLHSVYLLGCWILLRRAPGGDVAKLLAFLAAILSVVFYAYAPFLSHDLLPGLFFLLFIFLTHRWLEHRKHQDAIWLILLGAAVTLIKQTYVIVWFSVLLYAVVAWLAKWDSARIGARQILDLTAMAAGSAVISFTAYALFIGPELPDESFFTRPLTLVSAISGQYGDDFAGMFAVDLYFRNLPNYGIAAMLLVLPGVVFAWRGSDARMRQIAFCWLLAIVVMQLLGFREARYLGFLAPLTAMLIVPVVQKLLAHRATAAILVLIVVFDQYRGIMTAAVPVTAAAKVDVARVINAPPGGGTVHASSVLSFAYHPASPLSRDRYHGFYHLTPLLLSGLYEGRYEIAEIGAPDQLGLSGIEPGDRVYFSNNTLLRRPPWTTDNRPSELDNFLLVAGNVVAVELSLQGGAFERVDNTGSYVMFLPDADIGPRLPRINTGTLSLAAATDLYGDIMQDNRLSVLAVEVHALCQADACSYR